MARLHDRVVLHSSRATLWLSALVEIHQHATLHGQLCKLLTFKWLLEVLHKHMQICMVCRVGPLFLLSSLHLSPLLFLDLFTILNPIFGNSWISIISYKIIEKKIKILEITIYHGQNLDKWRCKLRYFWTEQLVGLGRLCRYREEFGFFYFVYFLRSENGREGFPDDW